MPARHTIHDSRFNIDDEGVGGMSPSNMVGYARNSAVVSLTVYLIGLHRSDQLPIEVYIPGCISGTLKLSTFWWIKIIDIYDNDMSTGGKRALGLTVNITLTCGTVAVVTSLWRMLPCGSHYD